MFALGPISFDEKTFGTDRGDVDTKKLKMPFFFLNHSHLHITAFIHKKNKKTKNVSKGYHAHTAASHKPADRARVPHMSRFCARRVHFGALEAVLF